MFETQQAQIEFESKADNAPDIAKEINDLKLIMLCIAFKLDESSRSQLIKELSGIDSGSIQQWISNLKRFNGS